MLAAAAGLAFIGGLLTDWLFYIGLAVCALFVILWVLNFKFNLFMDGKVKLFSFIKYDFKNEPLHYIGIVGIWGVVLFWFYRDVSDGREVGTDVLLALFSIYLVSCVMVLWGYYKDYDRLP
jgi:hypothetical protein